MNIIDFGQEVSLFHGESQFTLLQVFSWCLAMSIKVRQPCLEFCSIDCELINGYCRKLLKKKKKKKDQVKMELYIKGHLVNCKCPWMVFLAP